MATRRNHTLRMLIPAALAVFAAGASASPPGIQARQGQSASAQATGTYASPQERGQLTYAFVKKWGAYVERVYHVPVGTWAQRMVPNFANVDGANFRSALKRDTFEGAMAELGGVGHRLNDNQVINRLAKLPPGAGANQPSTISAKFGDLAQDLVYTPIQPCRIVDTRNTVAGAIPASGSRDFVAQAASSYAAQGGSATDCGMTGVTATAVALNVTAVGYTASGHAIVYPYGTTIPVTSSINFNLANFATNNGIIAKIPNPVAANDFTIWTVQSSHFVVDIVGYFAPPFATALQCQDTTNSITSVPAGATSNVTAPACPTGYTMTATNCESGSWKMPFVFTHAGTCSAQNNDTVAAELRASRTCCRVPGR